MFICLPSYLFAFSGREKKRERERKDHEIKNKKGVAISLRKIDQTIKKNERKE